MHNLIGMACGMQYREGRKKVCILMPLQLLSADFAETLGSEWSQLW